MIVYWSAMPLSSGTTVEQAGANDAFVKFFGLQKTSDVETLLVKDHNLDSFGV